MICYRWTELHVAAHQGNMDRAAAAMRQGADPLKLDKLGHTPRAIAICKYIIIVVVATAAAVVVVVVVVVVVYLL
jgi:hypothetical protein